MFELRNVSKRYGDIIAVDDVSLELPTGETTVLIGPSGCGKSTLLNMLNGLVTPDSGEVRHRGEPLDELELAATRRQIGYVIQEGGLFPHLTARQNVELVARLNGVSDAQRDRRVDELAELVRLEPGRLDTFPAELSGGQRQRVGLMRALMLEPPALLLDEPMGALDPLTRAELQADLRQIFDELDLTVVLVTHDLAEAAYLAETIVLLREGTVVQRDSYHGLRDAPATAFVEEFLQAQQRARAALE